MFRAVRADSSLTRRTSWWCAHARAATNQGPHDLAHFSRVQILSLDALTVDRLPARSTTHRSTASRGTSHRNPTAVQSHASSPVSSFPSSAVARATGVTCSSRFSTPAACRGRTRPPPLLNPCRCTASSPRTASSPSTASPRCRRRSTTLSSSSSRRRTTRPRCDASSRGTRRKREIRPGDGVSRAREGRHEACA